MNPGNFDDDDKEEESSNNPSDEVSDYLAEYTLEGKWDKVVDMYNQSPVCHTTMINESVGTALHVAVDLDEEGVVQDLVNAIINYRYGVKRIKALEMGNDRGDTPLHVAASRGFAKICRWIIGMEKERIYLASRKNKHGETPLFEAAINWKKQAFAYLSSVSGHSVPLQDLVRHNGDTILHCAIRKDYFDLAVIIVHYYDFLSTHKNKDGLTPLAVLANRPSAFRSGTNLSWWKLNLYHCILVEPLNPEREMYANLRKIEENPKSDKDNYPKNYATLYDFFAGLFSVASLFELKEVKKTKKRHEWSRQLFKAILKRPYASFTGSGGVATDIQVEQDMYYVYHQYKQGETSELQWLEEENKTDIDDKDMQVEAEDNQDEVVELIRADKKETAFLVAARNGIVEMVNELLNRIPSVIHNTNSMKENVLLVAVMNRQPLVVESLKMKMHSKPEVWNNLILTVDVDENTILHLAAYAPRSDKFPQIASPALQMMWDTKWFQYVKSHVPQDFYYRINKKGKTATEIFEETHENLIEKSKNWLKETSESCSVVAVLVAGVSFATTSSIPGGTNNEGRPNLEGKLAFDIFSAASLVGLCFSVTGLIMFLTILTSQKQSKDFHKDLPFKILLGLSSLFLSIAAMFVSFCSGHYFLLSHRNKMVLYPLYAATVFPITLYAMAQFPLYFQLSMTILARVPWKNDKGEML